MSSTDPGVLSDHSRTSTTSSSTRPTRPARGIRGSGSFRGAPPRGSFRGAPIPRGAPIRRPPPPALDRADFKRISLRSQRGRPRPALQRPYSDTDSTEEQISARPRLHRPHSHQPTSNQQQVMAAANGKVRAKR